MRNPEDRSPQEWAEELREATVDHKPSTYVWDMTAADCTELAERMDDLVRAVWVLRNIVLGHDIVGMRAEAAMLVAKYEEVDSE